MKQLMIAGGLAALLAACATTNDAADRAERPAETGEAEVRAIPQDMSGVMTAKLAHAQAILEGIVRGDFRQVETNAEQLLVISEHAEWLAHDTMAYVAMSDGFRREMQAMIRHARAADLDEVLEDYQAMTASCSACHDYLLRARTTGDFPGETSRAPRPAPRLARVR